MANIEWEQRAKARSLENKRLNKKVKEVVQSRDAWKKKAIERGLENDILQKKISTVKKKLEQITEL